MRGKRYWIALTALGVYCSALLLFQSRLTWENFDRQLHITKTARSPFTLGPAGTTVNSLRPEAAAAGLKRGDRLIALDGKAVRGERSPQAAVTMHRTGDTLRVTVERNGVPFTASIRLQAVSNESLTLTDWILFAILGVLTPWFCLILGFGVALQRPLDPMAWLLLGLLMSFGGVAQAGGVLAIVSGWEMPARAPAEMYYLTITNSWGFWMLLFGQYFPDRSAGTIGDRIVRWVIAAPLACYAVLWGASNLLASEYALAMPFEAAIQRWSTTDVVVQMLGIGIFFANVFLKMWRAKLPDARRRLRLLMSGAAVSLTPALLLAVAALLMGRTFTAFVRFSPWLWVPSLLLIFLFPVTLAYVIVVEQAMEVNVVVRQGLQYALARGGARAVMGSLFVAMAIYSSRVAYEPGIARPQLVLLIVVLAAAVVVWRLVSARLYSWIDRHFFREAVNTEHVLAELSEQVRTIVEAEPLLRTVTETIAAALHVNRVAALIRRNGDFVPAHALGYGPAAMGISFPANGVLAEPFLRQSLNGGAWSAKTAGNTDDRNAFQMLGAELLLPLAAKDRLLGILSLGPKRSEAPYSPSDIRLLEAVAAQTGLALENSRLMAEMAREVAHRELMARELEIARDVQQRLFPQQAPPIEGLDYAGRCWPASTIGGDYYDFLSIPGNRLGFAIGDVSGKGIPAALLMASLRASLHGLAIANTGEIAELMVKLNELIYEASSAERYASLFYGVFDPASRAFPYVNAGHNPPIVFRASSRERIHLDEGGLMVGTFRSVPYRQGSITLTAGDTIIMFTDGLSEAVNPAGEEFGEDRIVAAVQQGAGLPAAQLVDQLLSTLQAFTAGSPQYDDITVVVMRVL